MSFEAGASAGVMTLNIIGHDTALVLRERAKLPHVARSVYMVRRN